MFPPGVRGRLPVNLLAVIQTSFFFFFTFAFLIFSRRCGESAADWIDVKQELSRPEEAGILYGTERFMTVT